MVGNTSRIVVHRSKAMGSQDIFRAYAVVVDGIVHGKLRRGDSLTCEVISGTHVVQATINWAGSPEVKVDLEPGETVELDVAGIGGGNKASRAAIGEDAKHSYLRLTVRGAQVAE